MRGDERRLGGLVRAEGWVEGWEDGWMEGWMDGWIVGWMNCGMDG